MNKIEICKGGNHPMEMRHCTLRAFSEYSGANKTFYHCWNIDCYKLAKKQAKQYLKEQNGENQIDFKSNVVKIF